jgi:uncharacterized protein YdaU (DUF1376 family)
MAKDPAFLFYYQDFLVGTDDMTNDEVGAYIRCLCHQASKGSLTDKHMMKICLSSDIYKSVVSKFSVDEDGSLFNERLRIEVLKRAAFAESRRNNRLKSNKNKHMKNISKTYVRHMENENEDIIINKKNKEKNKFIAPTIQEVIAYFEINGYPSTHATHVFNYYADANWKDSKGQPVRNWKQKMRGVWFDDKYKTQKPISNTTYAPITSPRS